MEIPSPAGPFYPPSPRYHEPPSPRPGYSPNISYFTNSKLASSRQRTLIEIPRHDPGPQKTDRDLSAGSLSTVRLEHKDQLRHSYLDLQPEMSAREMLGVEIPQQQSVSRPINIRKNDATESKLDPNSRPFTPAGRYNASSLCASEASSSDIYFFQPEQSETDAQNVDFFVDYAEAEAGEDLDFPLEYDPLPEDPSTLLPDLETTVEDLNNNNATVNNKNLENNNKSINISSRFEKFDLPAGNSWKVDLPAGNSWKTSGVRPPLLPTPVNFPPFGPTNLESLGKSSFSGEPRGAKGDKESRLLVSGVEQSLNTLLFGPPLASSHGPHGPPPASSHGPLFASSHGPSISHPHGPSLASSHSRSQPHSNGPSLVSVQGPPLMPTHGPSLVASHGPSHGPSSSAYGPSLASLQRNNLANTQKRQSGSGDSRLGVSSWGPPPSSSSTGGLFTQDLSLPAEYRMSPVIGDRIRPINVRQEHTDLLFFLFYSLHGDALQLVAASLLFERGWRFHKQDRLWLARWPGVKPEEKTVLYEKGLYQYFDVATWKRIPGWFRLDYCHLADKTLVPEDLKTMYSRYCGLMRDISDVCDRNIALYGLNGQVCDEFSSVEGKKYMQCIL